MKYTVTTFEDLRQLCIKNNWFTCGSCEQYEKMFRANESGCFSIEQIAMFIWACSSEEILYTDVLNELLCEHASYVSFSDGIY